MSNMFGKNTNKKIIQKNNTRFHTPKRLPIQQQLPVNSTSQTTKPTTFYMQKRGGQRSGVRDIRPLNVVATLAPKSADIKPSRSFVYVTPEWFQKNNEIETSVIVPLYKSSDVIQDFINSWDIPNSDNVELIFVDDNCPNGTKNDIVGHCQQRKWPKGVGQVISKPENGGFGYACNVGAQHARGKYLIFINADTTVTPNWITPITSLLNDSTIGIVGNLQLKAGGSWDGTIDSAGSQWQWRDMCFMHLGRHLHQNKHLPHPFTIKTAPPELLKRAEREMVTGCCVGIRKELFEHIGGFDPHYHVGYWEDSEICMVVRELGYKVMFEPASIIHHKLGHTNSGTHKYHQYNRNYFVNKWIASQRLDALVSDKREKPKIQHIAVQRMGANGDVLMATAVLPALKAKYPGAELHFVTDCANVLLNNPYVTDVKNHPTVYDVIFDLDLAYEIRPKANILEAYANACGVDQRQCRPFIWTSPYPEELPAKYIAIHAGQTAWVGRNWTIEGFSEIASRLMEAGHYVCCIGGPADNSIPCNKDLRGKGSLAELAYVIKNSTLFLGIDSFPFHIAQTFDVPGLAFFGSIDPKSRIISPRMHSITAPHLACLGCHHRKAAPSTVTNTCETENLDCISQVSVENMWQSICKLL